MFHEMPLVILGKCDCGLVDTEKLRFSYRLLHPSDGLVETGTRIPYRLVLDGLVGIRTRDPLLARQVLYRTELRAPKRI